MRLEEIITLIDSLLKSQTVPRNIRKTLEEAKERLNSNDETIVKVSSALYLIEPLAEDINIEPHVRAQLWAIVSALEAVKE